MKKYAAYYNRKTSKLEKNLPTLLTAKTLSAELAGVIYKKKAYRYHFQKLFEVVTVRAENENLREL